VNSQVETVDGTITITDNDTAVWTLTQTSAQDTDGVDEGASAIYTLTLDGTDGATTTGGATANGAVQSGETATINLNRTFGDTVAGDFDETLDAAVLAAINTFNGTATAGDPGTFSYALGVVTFTGDGTQTAPALTIDLDIANDSLIESDEGFTLDVSDDDGSVASQTSVSTTDNSVTTTINDDDTANWVLAQSTTQASDGVDEGTSAIYTLTLDGSASDAPGAAAVQSGDTATIELSLGTVDTLTGDFDETLGAAVNAAVANFNSAAGVTAGAAGSFSYAAGVVTFTGDGALTAPTLTIDLNTNDDSLVEGSHDFSYW